MSSIKYVVHGLIYWCQLIFGLLKYAFTKKTSKTAHQAMIMLFCRTRGYSSDALSWIISLFQRSRPIPEQKGILALEEADEAKTAAVALRERGYYVFENKLPDELCDRLLQFATQHPAVTRLMDSESGESTRVVYDRDKPLAVRYDFTTQDLLENPDVQKILADFSFVSVAQEYLCTIPTVDVVAMWWHTNFSDRPDSEAAQYFHFDMDRPKWLKFFVYLTDVSKDNGPHYFVAGSHKSRAIPEKLLKKGYARLSDEEVSENFNASDVIEFVAPRGTILAEDTRGLHKGKHLASGDRLMFQFQFSNSLFGATYPNAKFPAQLDPELKKSIGQYPEVYSAFM